MRKYVFRLLIYIRKIWCIEFRIVRPELFCRYFRKQVRY